MTTPTALTAIHRAALNLVTEAQRCGVVVTIETTPHHPLAMGNHDMSVSVREARRPPPFAAEYSARLGTELGMPSWLRQAVQHVQTPLPDPGSIDYAAELQALRKKVATYEARDALGLVPASTTPYAPLTAAEARDLTCMLAGAPWPDEMLPELQHLLGIYDGLRAHGQRPVDPASLPDEIAQVVMETGLLPDTGQPTPATLQGGA